MIICTGDHEYSIYDSVSDHDEMPRQIDCELHNAELVVSLEGYRGHYLGRDFIYEAIELAGEMNTGDTEILDKYETDYEEQIEPGYSVAECVSDMVQEYENRLFDRGFYVEWNDGVQVVKVNEEIRE